MLFCSIGLSGFTQTIFHQDTYHGGVTVGGLSSGMGGDYTDTLQLHIPNGSSIKRIVLFFYSMGFPKIKNIYINDNEIAIDTSSYIMRVTHKSQYVSPITIYSRDLTTVFSNSLGTFILKIPGVIESFNWGWFVPILYIEYEDPNMPLVTTSLWINDKDYVGQSSYNFSNMNPINTSLPVALSIFEDRACNTTTDGTVVTLNGNNLGTIGGSDLINDLQLCGGAKGHFYYENQTIYGLDDDVPNNSMNGTDALADISSYLNPNSTSYNLALEHIEYPIQQNEAVNIHLLFINAYTTPCDTFTTTVTQDTTICYGETLQLQATGGQSYEWTAVTDSASGLDALSCTDCPNPVFTGNSSQIYTVRIWNNDSCSVVKPVRINVSQPEEIKTEMLRSICGLTTGKISVLDLPNEAIQLGAVTPSGDTINPSSENMFSGLSAGNYSIFYIDKFGCSVDTLIYVEPVINTVAQFNAYPKKGSAPIQINLSNQSQNATDYSWWLNDAYQGNDFSGFYTDTSGIYELELIAWGNDSICADTTSFTVIVFDSLVVTLPNVFTPNNDGVNDYFNVKTNLAVSYQLSVLNRWGNVVFEQEGELAKGIHNLWDGKTKNSEPVTDGTYFYTISFKLDSEEVDCEITDCELRKEGFVQVFGE